MTNQLIISNTLIPVDHYNRVNLNALHKASGKENSKRPSIWLTTKSACELVNELSKDSCLGQNVINKQRGGNGGGGTFAHELLAISYAGWISPKFQLEVNRVFLHSKRNEPELATLPTLSELPILDFPEMRLSMFIPFREMFDCGWRLRMNQLFTILRQCQRSNTPISVKDVTGLEQELRSLLHIVETQSNKLSSIQQFVNH
ncbi:KilA-N domain-containing protein [Pseudoalteromonas undina]|uniref:KilA-N domain-containing protein n=1 Tax=Pseudoalteromonas undina TaxID=43660 RepID=UPI00186957D2|nr:KilA-N domain-containing protein [Pseudoalteromonas undina]